MPPPKALIRPPSFPFTASINQAGIISKRRTRAANPLVASSSGNQLRDNAQRALSLYPSRSWEALPAHQAPKTLTRAAVLRIVLRSSWTKGWGPVDSDNQRRSRETI